MTTLSEYKSSILKLNIDELRELISADGKIDMDKFKELISKDNNSLQETDSQNSEHTDIHATIINNDMENFYRLIKHLAHAGISL